ncbi:hypothetical protein T03_550 [Trichinella britovi]|uniref:Uncharacterized protein n=1 Tax=Trichinella britovi TaxID=45882 RepID=A0A0V1CFU4_TRIBR|nr:hypothetical protein T03_550 [Trichinella britovi]
MSTAHVWKSLICYGDIGYHKNFWLPMKFHFTSPTNYQFVQVTSMCFSTHLEEVINCIPKLVSWWRVDFSNVLEMTATKLSQQLQDMRPFPHYSVLLLYDHCMFDTSILSVLT